MAVTEKTLKSIESKLKAHSKALGIPAGSAETFIKKSLAAAKNNADINRAIVKELHKYNSDLAYVYENYDKII